MIKLVYKLLQKDNLIKMVLIEIKILIINQNNHNRSRRGLCKCEAVLLLHMPVKQHFGELIGDLRMQDALPMEYMLE